MTSPSADEDRAAPYRAGEYLFASYAHADGEQVRTVIERLREIGARVWFDAEIQTAAVWSAELYRAICDSAGVLVFLSPQAATSDFVRKEVVTALGRQKRLIVLAESAADLKCELGFLLSDVQALVRSKYSERDLLLKLWDAIPDTCRGERTRAAPNQPLTELADIAATEGILLLRQGGTRAARRRLQDAVVFNPRHAQARLWLGTILLREGEYEAARVEFLAAKELDPTLSIPATEGWRFLMLRAIRRCFGWLRPRKQA